MAFGRIGDKIMWSVNDIDDLQVAPTMRVLKGYGINIRPALMADDLKPFVVTPSSPARRFADDVGVVNVPLAPDDPNRPGKLDFSNMTTAKPTYESVFLIFPDLETAKATSLGQYWIDE
jgi:hypothetical protein